MWKADDVYLPPILRTRSSRSWMLKPEGELLVARPESQVSESGYFGTVFENMKHEARNLSRCVNSGGRGTRRLPRAKRKAVPRSSLRCRLATSAPRPRVTQAAGSPSPRRSNRTSWTNWGQSSDSNELHLAGNEMQRFISLISFCWCSWFI